MNISSAVVYAIPQSADAVRDRLRRLQGVEIHAETADGRFIVTVEDVPGFPAADTVMRLHQLEGIRAAAMVYQYCEEDGAADGEEARA